MTYPSFVRKAVLLTVLFNTLIYMAMAQISPLDFGLREAQTGIDRYRALYNTHVAALADGVEVSYEGIDTLDIELPPDFQSIPVGNHTDFGGLVIYVTNNVRDGSLFYRYRSTRPLALSKAQVDSLDFREVPELAEGDKLLILSDQNPWTSRIGYSYKVYRQDVLWVHNGKAMNAPIAPWNTDSTHLNAVYADVDTSLKTFGGLTMHRTAESQFKTYCLHVNGEYNLLVHDIHVTTPKSKMIADGLFGVSNSVRVAFHDVSVEGTYSGYGRWRGYGYAFSLYNLWDTKFERVTADGNWGVFGTNNLSSTELYDCDINRFDIHCYGRDALLKRCTLRQRQTQFSSMYGTVTFDSCHFIDCIPVRIRSSYNAYTPFDIVMKDCTFELTMRYHSLVNVMLLDTAASPRPELNPKCWPNLTVTNMTVVVPAMVRSMNLYHPTGTLSELKKPVDHINKVTVSGLKMIRPNGKPAKIPVRLSSKEFIPIQKLEVDIPM